MRNLIYCIIAIFAVALMVSCRTTAPSVPNATVHETERQYRQWHDTIIKTQFKTLHDSVFVHDSSATRNVDGKTVIETYHTTDRWHVIDNDQTTHQGTALMDSMSASRSDTLRIPVPVEKKLTKWQRIEMVAGNIVVAVVIVLLLYGLVIVIIKQIKLWHTRNNI